MNGIKEYRKICINCPAGCHLEITKDSEGNISVTGNRCPRGEAYARQELTDPRRIVTAVVIADGLQRFCIPVKSSEPVPVPMIHDLLQTLYSMRVRLPVKMGQVLLEKYKGTQINVIATRSFQ